MPEESKPKARWRQKVGTESRPSSELRGGRKRLFVFHRRLAKLPFHAKINLHAATVKLSTSCNCSRGFVIIADVEFLSAQRIYFRSFRAWCIQIYACSCDSFSRSTAVRNGRKETLWAYNVPLLRHFQTLSLHGQLHTCALNELPVDLAFSIFTFNYIFGIQISVYLFTF